ncbi:unnamed protein product, partial [Laminaria digitata]
MHIYPQRELLQGSEGHLFNLVSYGATPDQWAEWLRVPLEHAAARGNLDLVTSLLDAGAGVKAAGWRGIRGRTLFDAAALGGNADVVSALLGTEARADAGVVSMSSGRSALYAAAKCGHMAAAQRLIVAGADVNFRDPTDNCGPLLRTVLDGHEQLAEELLNAGACPNMRGDGQRGWAPLHVAASCGQGDVLSALLAGGADKDALDDRGASPLHHAIVRDQVGSVRGLLATGADITTGGSFPALTLAASKGHGLIMKALLDHGADVNFCSPTVGRTALHAACSSHAIHMLVDAGAEVDAQRFDGGTPLHYAAASSSHEAMHALVQCAADTNARHSATNQTPLHVACQHQARGVDAAVDLLLRLGVDETAIGGDGRTAFDLLGLQIADGRGCSDDEKQRARALLARAKQDRAWRRRCWPVVLRSRALKAAQHLTLSNSSQTSKMSSGHPHVGDGITMAGEKDSTAGEIRDDGRIAGTIGDLASAKNDRGTGSRV